MTRWFFRRTGRRFGDLVTGTQARPLLVPTITARRNGIRKTLEQFSTPQDAGHLLQHAAEPERRWCLRAPKPKRLRPLRCERDLIVIADEAYEDLVYEGEHVSIASLPGMAERTITCFTFSKTYAMTGWRAGYAVAKEPFMTALRKIVLYSTNGVTTPVQQAMIHALTTPNAQIDAHREEYRKRRDLLVGGAERSRPGVRTAGGCVLCFPEYGEDSTRTAGRPRRFCSRRRTLRRFRASVFGAQGEGHLRFGYAITIKEIEDCAEALRRFKG